MSRVAGHGNDVCGEFADVEDEIVVGFVIFFDDVVIEVFVVFEDAGAERFATLFEELCERLEVVDFLFNGGLEFLCDVDAEVDFGALCEDVLPARTDEGAKSERDEDDDADHDGLGAVFWGE